MVGGKVWRRWCGCERVCVPTRGEKGGGTRGEGKVAAVTNRQYLGLRSGVGLGLYIISSVPRVLQI